MTVINVTTSAAGKDHGWSAKVIMSSSTPPLHHSLDDQNDIRSYLRDNDDDDADTASQRSISLSSPPSSPRHSSLPDARQSFVRSSGSYSQRESNSYTDYGSEADNVSIYDQGVAETPGTSAAPSVYDDPKEAKSVQLPTYPPSREDTLSISSYASGSSRKTRPESLLVETTTPLVLGIALVDFNHLVLYKQR